MGDPHTVIGNNNQLQFFVNVLYVNSLFISLFIYFLPTRLNSKVYRDNLEFVLPKLLENVPLAKTGTIYFMHDGIPPHFSIAICQFLTASFATMSPDLNPIDIYFECFKSLVYKTSGNTDEKLKPQIQDSCKQIS